MQAYEDKVNEVVMILDANTENLHSLSGFYANLMDNDDFDVALKRDCVEDIREFGTLIAGMVHDARMQIRRAKLLAKLTADRKALVCIHLSALGSTANVNADPSASARSGHRSDSRPLLHVLQGSHCHAYHHHRHANLPACNFCFSKSWEFLKVCASEYANQWQTFFSTDIVKYQDRDRDGSFSKVAMYRWLQVTLPLSALTLSIGYGWYRYKTTKSKKSKILPS